MVVRDLSLIGRRFPKVGGNFFIDFIERQWDGWKKVN